MFGPRAPTSEHCLKPNGGSCSPCRDMIRQRTAEPEACNILHRQRSDGPCDGCRRRQECRLGRIPVQKPGEGVESHRHQQRQN